MSPPSSPTLSQMLSPLLSSPSTTTYRIGTVSRILAERTEQDGTRLYLVDWVGYGPEYRSWQPVSAFEDDVSVLETWFVEQREREREEMREFKQTHDKEMEALRKELKKNKKGRRDSMSP